MKRKEIKIRAWDSETNKMIPYEILKNWVCLLSVLEWDQYEPMLFTGRKDKNNKDVFDGDICESPEVIFQVKWLDEACAFVAFNSESVPLSWFIDEIDIEVIGNIYENPELLVPKILINYD